MAEERQISHTSTAAGTGQSPARAMKERLKKERLAELRLTRGSRGGRGCSALLSALVMAILALVTVLFIAMAVSGDEIVLPLLGAAVFGAGTAGMGVLSARWARGLPPWEVQADPAAVKELAAKQGQG